MRGSRKRGSTWWRRQARPTLDERVVILEDTRELKCAAADCVALGTKPGVAMLADLVRSTLRLRPDRIIVGEVRGPEALDMLKAWNTGHPGGITTVHANSAHAGLYRLEHAPPCAVGTSLRSGSRPGRRRRDRSYGCSDGSRSCPCRGVRHALGGALQRILESIENPVTKVIAVVIIIVTGLSLAFGDMGGGLRRLIQIVFGLSIAFAATSFFLSFLSFAGGALIE
jgi:type IV secretory pathway VirB2 component (pilin)